MKNKFTKIIILLMMGSFFAKGQTEETNFRFGIHASPNISWLGTNDPNADGGAKLKFGFGLLSEYYFAQNYAFSGGIDVLFRGGRLSTADNLQGMAVARDGDFGATYVQIPIKLKMRSREFGYFRGFAEFGTGVGVEVAEKVSFNPDIPEPLKEPSYVSPINFIFTVGLGAEYDLGGNTSIMAGLYFNRSLIDNLNNNYAGIRDRYNYRFDYVNLRLGFLF